MDSGHQLALGVLHFQRYKDKLREINKNVRFDDHTLGYNVLFVFSDASVVSSSTAITVRGWDVLSVLKRRRDDSIVWLIS